MSVNNQFFRSRFGQIINSSSLDLNSQFNGSIIPSSDSFYDLGSSSLKWNQIYANTIHYDTLDPQPTATIPDPLISNNITSRQSLTGNIITANSIASEYISGSLIQVINNTFNLINYLSGSFQLNLSPYSNTFLQRFRPIENYCYLNQLQIKLRNDWTFGGVFISAVVLIRDSQNNLISTKTLNLITNSENTYTLSFTPNEVPLIKGSEYSFQVQKTSGMPNLIVYYSNSLYFVNSFSPLGGNTTSAFSVDIRTDRKIVANTIISDDVIVNNRVISGNIDNIGNITTNSITSNRVNVSGDVSIFGNLLVSGNHIVASVESVVVEDNIMMLNKPNLNVQGFNFDSGIAISYSDNRNPALIYKKIPQTSILNGRIDRFVLGNVDVSTANLDANGNPFGGNAVFTDLSTLHIGSLEGNLISGNLSIGLETARTNIGGNLNVGGSVRVSGTVFGDAYQGTGIFPVSFNSTISMATNDITNVGSLTAGNITATNLNATNWMNFFYIPPNVIDTYPKNMGVTTSAAINGALNLVYFFPLVPLTVSSMGYAISGVGTDVGGTTVRRYGLYQPTSTNGNTLNLIARTAVTNTIGTTGGYTNVPFSTVGGFPSSVTLLPNTQYCFASIFYNTGGTFNAPSPVGCNSSVFIADVAHRQYYRLAGQTDIPTTITLTTTERTNFGYWGRLQ